MLTVQLFGSKVYGPIMCISSQQQMSLEWISSMSVNYKIYQNFQQACNKLVKICDKPVDKVVMKLLPCYNLVIIGCYQHMHVFVLLQGWLVQTIKHNWFPYIKGKGMVSLHGWQGIYSFYCVYLDIQLNKKGYGYLTDSQLVDCTIILSIRYHYCL